MKKFLRKTCIIFSLLLSIVWANSASAQLPFAASFDFGAEIKGVIQDIQAAFKTVETNVVGTIKGSLSKLQAAFDQYSGKITKVFDKIPGTKDFKIGSSLGINSGSGGSVLGSVFGGSSSSGLGSSSQSVDIYNAESVQKAFTELFLTYPSNEKKVQIAYDNKANKFYYDTLIEVKATITGLEEQLDKLRKEVEDFSEQAMSAPEGGASSGDSEGATSSEDESGIIYNAYLANRKFNDILKVTEEVVALQNQYYAAKLLRRPRSVAPSTPKETEQHSFLQFNQTIANAQFVKNMSNNKSYFQTGKKEPASATPSVSKSVGEQHISNDVKQSWDNIKDTQDTQNDDLSFVTNDNEINIVTNDEKTPTLEKPQNEEPVLTTNGSGSDFIKGSGNNNIYSSPEAASVSLDSDDFFAVPEAPETSSPLKYSQAELNAINQVSEAQKIVDKAADVHNLLQQLPSYKDTFVQYEKIKLLHDKSVLSLEGADNCVIKYINNYYNNPNNVWYGQSTEPTDHCDYDNRKGLSGWAITQYQLVNASSGNNIDIGEMTNPVPGVEDGDPELVEMDTNKLKSKSEGFIVPEINADDEYKDSVEYIDPEKKTEERDGETESLEDNFTDSNKAKEFSNSSREVSLINWQIGKAAACTLVKDQDNQSHPLYGQPHKKYALWNDVRSYYMQYITGKYGNMKAYLRQLKLGSSALRIVEVFNSAVTNEEERVANENDINAIASTLSNQTSDPSNLETLIQARDATIASIKQSQKTTMEAKQKKLDNINKKIDFYAQRISQINGEINRLNEEDDEVEDSINSLDGAISRSRNSMDSAQQSIDTLNKRGANIFSSLFSQAREKIQGARDKLFGKNGDDGFIGRKGILKIEAKNLENARKKEKEKAAKLIEEVEALKIQFANDLSNAEFNAEMAIVEAQENMPVSSFSSEVITNNTNIIPMIAKASVLVDKAKECAETLIDEHLANLKSMAEGDVLYMNSNNPNVVNKHRQLINNLKNLPSSCLISTVESQIGNLSITPQAIMTVLQNIFEAAITEDICSEYDCDNPDSDYFVGIIARKRDFTAPMGPLKDTYATIRDVVHLDTTDYKSIQKTEDGHISRDSLLDSGIILPDIWRRILSDGFVERSVNLADILNKGGEDKAFMRGMMLPCRLNGHYIIDIDEDHGKYKVIDTHIDNSAANTSRYSKLSDCAELKMGAHALGLYTIKDTDVKKDLVGNSSAGSIEDPVSSELGMLLKYEDGHLSINDAPYDGFEMLIEKEKKAEKKGKYKINAKENIYQRAMFSKNQIGEFLHFMDKEKQAREKLEQAEEDIAEVRETLKTTLSALGFELSDNVNLAVDEDYEEIVQKLKASKSKIMGQANAQLNKIDHSNPDVNERYEKAHNTYMALLQDNLVLVNISDNTEAGSSLSESIEREKANKKVVEKSRKDGYDALDDEIENYEQPICIPNSVILPIPVEDD